MPIVTGIKQQKRSSGRFSIYLDNTFAFGLSDLDLSTSGLKVGRELTEQEVAAFERDSEAGKAYERALRFLGYRSRSRMEMRDYLLKKEVAEELVGEVLERLEGQKYLDDREFARRWIADRQLLRPRSRRRLEQELMAKGVSRDDIREALSEFGGDLELEALVELAAKKVRLSQYSDPQKLMGYLGRQGYSYDLIKKALERLGDET